MRSNLSSFNLILAVALFAAWVQAAVAAPAAEERLLPRLSRPLAAAPGQTFTAAVVEFPPSARAVPHRHGEAFVYAYVLSGRVRSALEGGPPRTYAAGDDWFEAPGAHHTLTENVSRTAPARLLVVFVAPTGAVLKVPDRVGSAR